MIGHGDDDLLWNISGKAGENLATAYLAWLLGRPGIGEALRYVLTNTSNRLVCKGVAPRTNGLGEFKQIQLEVPTESETQGEIARGRLDMLIETADWIIGIESKFFAGFQPGQPEKYIETIKKRAGESNRNAWLILLVPLGREGKIKHDLEKTWTRMGVSAENVRCTVVTWQELWCNAGPEVEFEQQLLSSYVKRCCNPFARAKKLRDDQLADSNLSTRSAIGGTDVQREFLKGLAALGEAVPGLSDGQLKRPSMNWHVYEFSIGRPENRDGRVALFGFVDRKFYGLRSLEQTNTAERAFVMCVPGLVHQHDHHAPEKLKLRKVTAQSPDRNVLGIIRHAKADGGVWLVEDAELDLDAADTPSGRALWIERLEWVFGTEI